jgi:hypothetical protein
MTDPAFDEERELRSALGTLLADEPSPRWMVTDDVARGRSHLARRRARLGGGIALVAVLALVVGLVGPWRSANDANPAPLGSASPSPVPSGAQQAVADYLASIGWPVTATKVTISVEDGSIASTTYSVRSAKSPALSATLVVNEYDTKPPAELSPVARARPGSAMALCLPGSCVATSSLVGCTGASPDCATDVLGVITKEVQGFPPGTMILDLSYVDGTELEGVASPSACASCAAPRPDGRAFLTSYQLRKVLDLTGKPVLREGPRPVPSTSVSSTTVEAVPNPFYVGHSPDRTWAAGVLGSLSSYVQQQGATAEPVGTDGLSVQISRGHQRAWLQVGYATTTADAPECLGLPQCTVLQPWMPARGGTVEVALTETTIAPGTSNAMRGPSYQLLVRSGRRLVRLDEGTTFGTLLNGDVQGFVLSADQLVGAAARLTFPSASPSPSAS